MKNKKGFTLLELLICIALISVVIIFLFRLISLIRQDEKAVGYIRANQASRNQVVGEIGSIIAENAVCSYSTTGSNSRLGLITLNLCTGKTLVIETKKDYIKYEYDGMVSKYPMKDKSAWFNPLFTLTEGNYYGYDYHKIVFKTEKKGLDASPIDDIEIFWVDKNGFADDDEDRLIHAQFLPGVEFNKKIRNLSNPYISCRDENMYDETDYGCFDTNITSIVRTSTLEINPTDDNIVSTSNSPVPIVAWYNNGVLKLYSEAPLLTLSPDSTRMFSYLHALTSIDFSTFDTSQVTNFTAFFQNDVNLVRIDLSSFDTHNARNMSYMFDMPGAGSVGENTSKLKNIVFGPGFDTSNVVNMRYMFTDNASIESLDLSMFDTSNVTDFTGLTSNCGSLSYLNLSNFNFSKVTTNEALSIFYNDNNLQTLITPKYMPTSTSLYINLPYAMKNATLNRTFTKIDSTTPSNIELTKVS